MSLITKVDRPGKRGRDRQALQPRPRREHPVAELLQRTLRERADLGLVLDEQDRFAPALPYRLRACSGTVDRVPVEGRSTTRWSRSVR